ncbi:MAG: hypothetical protein WA828_15210 [Coleofasciculaceae cyanobacterium]
MQMNKSLVMAAGLSLVTAVLGATQANANSYSDITGTNIWNNTAPIFDTNSKLDPNLLESITRVNRDSETALRACNEAIAQIEQNRRPSIRQFLRDSSSVTAATPETPTACRQLEQLRTQADSLRRTVQDAERARGNSAFGTW